MVRKIRWIVESVMTTEQQREKENYGVSQSVQWRLDSMVQDTKMSVEDSLLEWLEYKTGEHSPSSKEKQNAFVECIEVVQYLKTVKNNWKEKTDTREEVTT
jgi:hypothetical protein